MANITSLLEIIRTAHLGRDMRAALHDAIEAVNNDTETSLGKSLTFASATRKLSLKAKNGVVLSEVVIPGGGSGGGSVDSVNGVYPDENGNVELNLDDINDVEITSASDGDALVYDSASGKWVNGAGGGGTSGGSNENLLLNPWFNVNTTGWTTGTVQGNTSKPLFDRWWATYGGGVDSYGTITLNADHTVTFHANVSSGRYGRIYILQKFEDSIKNALGTHAKTISILLSDGRMFTQTFTNTTFTTHTFTFDVATDTQVRGDLVYRTTDSPAYIQIGIGSKEAGGTATDITIKAVKLELGIESTLVLDVAPNQNLETIKCNGVMRSNRNLLDNPWFSVNQKGFTSKTSSSDETNVKFLDRWKGAWFAGAPSQIVLNSDNTLSLKINKNSSYGTTAREIKILQEIENYDKLIGKQCTMSVMLSDGTIYSATKIVPSSGQEEITMTIATGKKLMLALDNRNSGMYKHAMFIRFSITSDIYTSSDTYEELRIKAVKLELGSESTLHLDTAPDYASELLKCQRYFYPLSGKSYNAMVSPLQQTRQWLTITLPTEMRAVPTFSGSLTTEGISGSSPMTNSVTSSNISVTNKQDIDFNFTTSSNYNLCSCTRVNFSIGSYLSAEL